MLILGIQNLGYPSQYGADVQLTAVLVQRDYGLVGYIGQGDPEWVREHGEMIPHEQARRYWPGLPAGKEVQ